MTSDEQVAEKHNPFVTPAQAGLQKCVKSLDSRFRGNDEKERFPTFYRENTRAFLGCHPGCRAGDPACLREVGTVADPTFSYLGVAEMWS